MFELAPRWKKVFQDLVSNKTRTILTMLSIAVGVFAVGLTTAIGGIAMPDMDADFQSANAFAARISCDPFDETLLPTVRQVSGVSAAEGRSAASGQLLLPGDKKAPITITGIPPLAEMTISILKFPATPPSLEKKDILLERSAAYFAFKENDLLTFELPDGKTRQLRVKGYVHDVTVMPYGFSGTIPAYASPDTIEWLGGGTLYNRLYITVAGDKKDKIHVSNIANAVSDKLKKGGIDVDSIFIFNPGRHFASDIFTAIMAILNFLGWLTVFLSAFLVINTINSLLAQHIRQIGIMKSIGGRPDQILCMYLILIFIFGLFSFWVAVPLASLAAYQVCGFMAQFINFDLRPFRIIPAAVLLQALIAFVVPIIAALIPVLNGVRISVREAITSYGVNGSARSGANWIDRVFKTLHFLSRPLLISLRNSIRRKGRLALTLSTLTLGGAIFMAVFNLWASFGLTIQQVEGYFLADVNITLTRSYRLQKVEDVVLSIPNVTGFEGWKSYPGQVLAPDKKSEVEILFYAPPVDSTLIQPILTAGRWLQPGDENALVIGNHLIKERPDLKVGDDVLIKVKEKEYSFHIVGIFQMAGNITPPVVYTTPAYLSKISATPGQIFEVRVITRPHTFETESEVARALQERFRQEDMPVSYVRTGIQFRQQQQSQTDVMIYFLLVMATLIALVGGLGLMGSMGMNVMERTREFGIMRSIGASNADIQRIVIAEGLLVGLVSWVLALVLSFPITWVLNQAVGLSMFTVPLDFIFNPQGVSIWLAGVLLLATFASALPAWNASRLTIREVLAYE